MPYSLSKRETVSQKRYAIQPGKIVVKLSTILFILFAALAIQILTYFWPKELPPTVLDVILYLTTSTKLQPAFIGTMLSFVTWHVFYFDSIVPGMNPPTPLSPLKYRSVSGSDFHLHFLLALFIGPMVAMFLYLDLI